MTKLEYIQHYRAQGFTPIPLHGVKSGVCTCAKGAECTSGGKHPRVIREAAIDATEEQWRDWCAKWPQMNIGILTGVDTGVMVLDVDPRHGGDESLKKLIAEHGALPPTVTASTGGSGSHYLFLIPPGVTVKNSASDLAPGLDIRGNGGLIVVAPSRTQGDYSWN